MFMLSYPFAGLGNFLVEYDSLNDVIPHSIIYAFCLPKLSFYLLNFTFQVSDTVSEYRCVIARCVRCID